MLTPRDKEFQRICQVIRLADYLLQSATVPEDAQLLNSSLYYPSTLPTEEPYESYLLSGRPWTIPYIHTWDDSRWAHPVPYSSSNIHQAGGLTALDGDLLSRMGDMNIAGAATSHPSDPMPLSSPLEDVMASAHTARPLMTPAPTQHWNGFDALPLNGPDIPDRGTAGQLFTADAFLSPTPFPSASPLSYIERLDQLPYKKGQPISEGTRMDPIYFNDGEGVLLFSDLSTLANAEQPAFRKDAKIGSKMSLRFNFRQPLSIRPEQVRVRHGNANDGCPRSLKELAEVVADQLKKSTYRNPLLHNGVEVSYDELLLLRIDHVAKGSFQPILAIRRRTGG